MKKIMVVMAAMALVIAMVSGAFAATTSTTVNSQAIIEYKCAVSGSPAISFGTLDALTAGPYNGSVTDPTLYCTSAGSITVADDGGENGVDNTSYNLHSGTNLIPYTLTYGKTLTGQGIGVDIGGAAGLNIAAHIDDGAIDSAPAGTYTDAVLLTITY